MRIVGVLAVVMMGVGCSSRQRVAERPQLPPRVQPLETVLSNAEQWPCLQGLHEIPSTVVDVGDFRHVPYESFSNGNVELNAYGDPSNLVGLEAGTRTEDPSLQQCLIQFVAAQTLSEQDRNWVLRFTPSPALDRMQGLSAEVTPSNAPDAYGAWWISLEMPENLANARASAEELAVISQPHAQWAPPPPTYYRRPARTYVRYPTYRPVGVRVYVPGFVRPHGVYVHSAVRVR
jgi:hypothetical protein